MSCLLGVCDVAIPSDFQTCSQTNKIGGTPDWPDGTVVGIPNCQVCNKSQFLIVQLYCCLDKSRYHRTLYVFACTDFGCWNNSQSWTVYRCQTEDNSIQQPLSSQDTVRSSGEMDTVKTPVACDCSEAADNRGVAADDWGVAADDWGVAADDWGVAADDWGVAADDWNLSPSKDDVNITDKKHSIISADSGRDITDLKQLCIDDSADDNITDEKLSESSHVISEDMLTLSEEEKSDIRQTFHVSDSVESNTEKVLSSYFINVFEEPDVLVEDNDRVFKLLKDYQNREGCNLKEMMKDVRFDGGGQTEKYERSSLLHKDFVFHKFMKRLSMCPEQCVRYQWNGSALFNSYPSRSLPNTCGYCGEELVFELQLTPALISNLRFPHQKEPAIEFGTVIVYTCKQSCWDPAVPYRTENTFVQPDPDQHLFK